MKIIAGTVASRKVELFHGNKIMYTMKMKSLKKDLLYMGAVVGYIKISDRDYGKNIDDIETMVKGKGIGTKAILNQMKQAVSKGYILTLTSDAMRGKAGQKLNRELYLKLGFVKNSKDNKIKNISEEFYYPKQ